nr:MAG TPA: Protein of unknown function (DUF3972) [Caudoviricetes sp.]
MRIKRNESVLSDRISKQKKEIIQLKKENKILRDTINENEKIISCKDQTIKVLKNKFESMSELYNNNVALAKNAQADYEQAVRDLLFVKNNYTKQLKDLIKNIEKRK